MRTVHFFATYYEQHDKAYTLIQSLLSQTADNWKLTICSNADKSVYDLKIDDPRITIMCTETNTEFWGALNRKAFIDNQLLDDELLINTSVEDYYIPKLVEYLNTRSEDFIMWDFSHHHFAYSTFFAITHPRVNKVDWGNFAIKGHYAKQVDMSNLPTVNPENRQEVIYTDGWKNFRADGYFVEYTFRQFPQISNVRLPKILFVKN